jgi:hypothetical protein
MSGFRPRGGWGPTRSRGRDGSPNNLIHTNNSPKPVSMRVSERFNFPNGLPLGELLEALHGPFLPLEALVVRRYANGEKTTG